MFRESRTQAFGRGEAMPVKTDSFRARDVRGAIVHEQNLARVAPHLRECVRVDARVRFAHLERA